MFKHFAGYRTIEIKGKQNFESDKFLLGRKFTVRIEKKDDDIWKQNFNSRLNSHIRNQSK